MKTTAFLLFCAYILSSCSANPRGDDISMDWLLYRNQFIISEVSESESASFEQISLSRIDGILGEQLGSYGSLKRVVRLEPGKPYSLQLPEIYSASRVWIDGILQQQYGSLGTSRDSSESYYREAVIGFTPASSISEIVIEYSNFHYPHRSAVRWAYVGDSTAIHGRYIRGLSIDYLVLGSLVICFLLFFLLFLVHIQNRYNL